MRPILPCRPQPAQGNGQAFQEGSSPFAEQESMSWLHSFSALETLLLLHPTVPRLGHLLSSMIRFSKSALISEPDGKAPGTCLGLHPVLLSSGLLVHKEHLLSTRCYSWSWLEHLSTPRRKTPEAWRVWPDLELPSSTASWHIRKSSTSI